MAWGCRFGRAPGDGLGDFPAERLELDAGAGAEGATGAVDTGTPVSSVAGARATSTGTSASPASSAVSGKPSTAGAGAAGSAGSPSKPSAADSCSKHSQIEVCDPIANTGCLAELGMQCDVDLLAGALIGMCVWSSPPPDPSSCLAIFPTQSCPAQSTCVEGKCLKICLCDADCEAAERCAMPLGASGFKTCATR